MSNSIEFTEWVARWRTAGIAMLLSTAVAVGANAQQTTPGSTDQRTPCPPPQVSGSASSGQAGTSGASTYGATGSASASGATAGVTGATAGVSGATTTAPTATNGTPTDAATPSGVAANPTPNNTSTNPDDRFKGLNATNGAAGVGADTTTTGKRTATVSGSLPADSANARANGSAASATKCPPSGG
jgi:hypothetical protein